MKKVLLFVFLLPASVLCIAQTNLVPNPSFEYYTSCPQGSDLYKAYPWFSPNPGSPDFFHECSSGAAAVPLTAWGYQDAKTGQGFGGVFVLLGSNSREYMETPLTNPLEAGKKYCVEFHVNLADGMNLAIDALGAFLSPDSLLGLNTQYFPVTPQIENVSGNIITEKSNWVKISGSFIAQGGEAFLTIGNFKSDSDTQTDTVSTGTSPFPYYYIEDVSVYLCDSLSSVPEITVPTLLNTGSQLYITGMKGGNYRLSLYDVRGRKVYHSEDYRNEFYCYDCRDALYLYELVTPGGERYTGKIVIMREP